MSIDEKREELKRTFHESIRATAQYARAHLPAQDCIEDLIVSLGNAMATAAGEMEKGDYDVHPSV